MNKNIICKFFLLGSLILFNSCELTRCMVYNIADVKDYRRFPSRIAQTNDVKFCFEDGCYTNPTPVTMALDDKQVPFEEYLSAKGTLAFLVIHKDSIVYEKYFNDYQPSSVIPSFSVAKAFTSTLIGCAIDDGYIKSVNQPVTDFLPEMKNNGFDKVTIRNLLQMKSGIKFHEGYMHLLHGVPSFYYGVNLRKKVSRLKLKSEPGTEFEYCSANTELLGLILEKSLKNKTITQYLQEKIWQPLGMEHEATWSVDKKRNGIEKTFCCLNASARDFAKFGRLYLKRGNWNGKQIVSENWIYQSVVPENHTNSEPHYQYHWWIGPQDGDFYARGMLGQFVYVNPARDLIIVRLGSKAGNVDWPSVFNLISNRFAIDQTAQNESSSNSKKTN